MIAPDDFMHLVQWTPQADARAINADTDLVRAMNQWEREQRWRRVNERVRDAAIMAAIVLSAAVSLALWVGA